MNCRRLFLCVSVFVASLVASPAGTLLRFRTSVGDFDVELYDADKPSTVQNFLQYVRGGNYTNMIMHRIVENFVIQGGGFNAANLGTVNATLLPVATSAPVTNEFLVGTFYSNLYGTIAMAKTSDPDSATSQFFFNLADNSGSLDDTNNSGGFTVFGHVVRGTNNLNYFQLSPTNRVVKEINQGQLNELPVVYSADPITPTFEDFIYVNIKDAPAYTPLKGTYTGLCVSPDRHAQPVPGQFTVTTTASPKQKFSGNLRLGSTRYTFTGSFDTNGYATATAVSGKAQLAVELHTDGDGLLGTVASSNWVANLTADRSTFGRTNPATAFAGAYTVAIPGTNQVGKPAGYGFAAIRVDTSGRVKVAGSLADGTSFSQSTTVAPDGRWPIYVPLYRSGGSISGWMALTAGTNLHGRLTWRKPGRNLDSRYPGGFAFDISLLGSPYLPPPAGSPVLGLATWPIHFSGGDLVLAFTDNATLGADNKFTNPSPYPMSLNVALPSGLIKGSVTTPSPPRNVPFKGILLQNQNSGYGYFLGTDQSGRVSFTP